MRLAVALAAFVVGCGGVEPLPLDGVEIGTGALDGSPGFVIFAPGTDLTLAPGSQGGFHVFINLQLSSEVAEAAGELPVVSRVARRVSDGVLVSRTSRRVTLVDQEGVSQTEASLPLFLCPTPIGIVVGDEEIRLEVEVSSPDGIVHGRGEATFVPRCPGGDQAQFCRNICFG